MVTSTLTALLLLGLPPAQNAVVLRWPFVTEGWSQLIGSAAHDGDDRFAQDWYRSSEGTEGESVAAPLDGVVVAAGWSCAGYGRQVVILDSTRSLAVRLAHLRNVAVVVGQTVIAARTIVGTVGRTGSRRDCEIQRPGPRVAHLHVVAYRVSNTDLDRRPISIVYVGRRPSPFAVPFHLERD